jgi:hypothetical protein
MEQRKEETGEGQVVGWKGWNLLICMHSDEEDDRNERMVRYTKAWGV